MPLRRGRFMKGWCMFVKRFFCRYLRYILTLICGCAVITTGAACGKTSGATTSTPKNDPPPPAGASFYVSPTGSDSNPGTEAQPFGTIQKAANVVSPGNTVIVEDGVYNGSNQCSNAVVCLTRGGSAGQLVTFKSRNKWGAKIDGQNGVAATGFAFGGANYVRIQDFEIYGVANAGGSASGIEVSTAADSPKSSATASTMSVTSAPIPPTRRLASISSRTMFWWMAIAFTTSDDSLRGNKDVSPAPRTGRITITASTTTSATMLRSATTLSIEPSGVGRFRRTRIPARG